MRQLRVAGAPISWGVCEVPDWGHQLAPHRVLAEMASLGLAATELGPDGFLPDDPLELRPLLDRHGLQLVAGFIPVVLHRPELWEGERAALHRRCATLAAGGAGMAVIAAATGAVGYDATTDLDEAAWGHLLGALDETVAVAAEYGLATSLHPHYGTVVETPRQITRLLDTSGVDLCLDTGHVMVGGGDPVRVAGAAAGRVGHVHLKDVDTDTASAVRQGRTTYREAVAAGMYRPLGEGDLDLGAILAILDDAGFDGWVVLEQDTVVTAEPAPGEGPIIDAKACLDFLQRATEAA